MARDIKESDWKLLRQLHPIALERFCQRVFMEIELTIADTAKTHHQRYGDVYRLIHQRDRELAYAFDSHSRSTALDKIATIRFLGLLEEDEFLGFSAKTRAIIEAQPALRKIG